MFWKKREYSEEPIWTVYSDGEIRKSTLRKTKSGVLMIKTISEWAEAYEDGTVHKKSYVVKWFR